MSLAFTGCATISPPEGCPVPIAEREMVAGTPARVALPARPSGTGRAWIPEVPSGLRIAPDDFDASGRPDPSLFRGEALSLGNARIARFRVDASVPGEQFLKWTFKRPWEPGEGGDVYCLRLRIRGQGDPQ